MGGEDDGAVLAQSLDDVADLDDLLGIQTDGGLVQDQDLGIADEGLGEADTLLIALGQVADHPGVVLLQAHQLADLADMGGALQLAGGDLQVKNKVQVFRYGHVQVQGRLLRQVADLPLGGDRILQNVDAADAGGAGAGGEVPGDDVHGCGFSRAVRTQETHDLPIPNGERETVDAPLFTIGFCEIGYFDHPIVPPSALHRPEYGPVRREAPSFLSALPENPAAGRKCVVHQHRISGIIAFCYYFFNK